MPVRRSLFYIGAGEFCRPDDLDAYEKTGLYVAELKYDGMFVSVEVGQTGNLLRSRDTVEGRPITDDRVVGFTDAVLPCPGAVVIGELEAATESATQAALKRGYRKVYVYDVVRVPGGCPTGLPWTMRRSWLEKWHATLTPENQCKFELSPTRYGGFRAWFDEVEVAGGEGLVLKLKTSTAKPTRLDGKIDTWIKCKVEKSFDYVLLGEQRTKKMNARTAVLGLWDPEKEKFFRCLICSIPEEHLKPGNFEKLVVEVKAFQRFKSGSARSAGFVRIRTDRDPRGVIVDQCG